MDRGNPNAGFINPTLAETAGVEDENGNPIVTAPEPEKVTIDMLPVGSVWEMGDKRRIVLDVEDDKVLVHRNLLDEPAKFAAASFTGWARVDSGAQVEQMKANMEQLRAAATTLEISARFANLARVSRAMAGNFDTLSARAVSDDPGNDKWSTLVDARGMLARLAVSHEMLQSMAADIAAGISRSDFNPIHAAIVAALEVEALEEDVLGQAVNEAVGGVQPRDFHQALIGLVAIGWVNPPSSGSVMSLSDKAREALAD